MSPRKKTSARRRWPLIFLLCVCAGLTLLILKHRFSDSQPWEMENQKSSPANDGLNLGATNQTATRNDEDRGMVLIEAGNQLLAQGDYAGAAQRYQQAVAISPDQEDLHFNLAIALAKLGKTEDAKNQYEEALRIFPEYGEAHNNLGNLLMKENKMEEAVDQLREAVKCMPENASFHNNLGTAFGRQGKVPEAMAEFEQAVKLSPAYVEARVNLANTFLATGRVDEAINQLNEALRLKPDFVPALQAMQRARQRQDSSRIKK
jgi:tetratricopeptide (TPR) repeat protein